MTGPVGVGVVIVTGVEVNVPPVSVPTSFVQSSGCAAKRGRSSGRCRRRSPG